MDQLELLRSMREVGPTPPASLQAGRRELTARIAAERSARPRRRLMWPAIGAAAAAMTVGAIVVGSVLGVGTRGLGGADAAAAASLEQAATASLGAVDPVVAEGEYLRITTHAVYAITQSRAASPDSPEPASPADGTYLASQDSTLYIPADPAGEWVWVREASQAVQTFGPLSEEAAALLIDDLGHQAQVWRGAGGDIGQGLGTRPTAADWRALPAEPAQLLDHIRRITAGQGVSAEQSTLDWIAQALGSGTVPAEVRATMYQTLALVPGIVITEDQANLDGRTGTAFALSYGDDSHVAVHQELIVDPSSGQFIGERRTSLEPFGEIPAGTVMGWSAVQTDVAAAVVVP